MADLSDQPLPFPPGPSPAPFPAPDVPVPGPAGAAIRGFEGDTHGFPVRVYFEDTDAGGMVYHARYLHFLERARTECLRDLGISHAGHLAATGEAFVVHRCEIDYLRPARLDDLLTVTTRLEGMTGATLTLEQGVRRGDDVVVAARVRLVFLGPNGAPLRIPAAIRSAFAGVTSLRGRAARPKPLYFHEKARGQGSATPLAGAGGSPRAKRHVAPTDSSSPLQRT